MEAERAHLLVDLRCGTGQDEHEVARRRADGLCDLLRARLTQALPPEAARSLVGTAVIVFVFSLGFFITPAILGGGRSIMVAEFVFVQLFHTPNWGLAAAVSVVLVSITGWPGKAA